MANFCCSIELEPRTLRQGQLSQAREVAVDIVQNKEPKEATTTLVQGLRPVCSIKEIAVMMTKEIETLNIDQDKDEDEEETKDEKMMNSKSKNIYLEQTSCQCSCDDDSPTSDQSQPKEPLSAPF